MAYDTSVHDGYSCSINGQGSAYGSPAESLLAAIELFSKQHLTCASFMTGMMASYLHNQLRSRVCRHLFGCTALCAHCLGPARGILFRIRDQSSGACMEGDPPPLSRQATQQFREPCNGWSLHKVVWPTMMRLACLCSPPAQRLWGRPCGPCCQATHCRPMRPPLT